MSSNGLKHSLTKEEISKDVSQKINYWGENFKKVLRSKKVIIGLTIVLIIFLVAIFCPQIAPHDPYKLRTGPNLSPPSTRNLLGTDAFGRDVFSRVLFGTRISLLVAIVVAFFANLIGIPLGLVAGYYGKRVDLVVMRFVDTIFAFPWILIALVFAAIMSPSTKTVVLALSIVYSPQVVRLMRSKVLSLKNEDYIKAAKAMGESKFAILLKYILPNSFGVVSVQATIIMSFSILAEAGISYLGLGTQPPSASWGLMLSEASNFLFISAYLSIFPGLAILILVLAINFLGDGLRDIVDPKFLNVGR